MRVLHERDGRRVVLATVVTLADTPARQARGLTFRRSIPDDFAMVFRYPAVGVRGVHTVFVPFPIDVVWTIDDTVQRVETLRPWLGYARQEADAFYEFPAGTCEAVEPGDRLVLEE